MQSEYINGFTEERIIDYAFSFNTIQDNTPTMDLNFQL